MKKSIMILVLGALTACLVPANAQNTQDWQTSTMRGSGSSLAPQVTAVGATSAAYQATTTESYSPEKSGIRKAPPTTGEESNYDPNNPQFSPLGDAVLPMLLCAVVFCGVIALRRKRSALNR